MKLSIKNFGAIKDGEIDLSKKVYVFVGYNNTGKTYISQLMYALSSQSFLENIDKKLADKDLGIKIINNRLEITNTILKKFTAALNDLLVEEVIPKTFNISKNHHLLERAEIKILQPELEFVKNRKFELAFQMRADSKEYDMIQLTKRSESLEIILEEKRLPDEIDSLLNSLLPSFKEARKTGLIYRLLLKLFYLFEGNGFYLPASRLFYPTFYQYVFRVEKERRELISANLADIIEQGKGTDKREILKLLKQQQNSFRSPYTEPTNNLINRIYDLNTDIKAQQDYVNYIEILEELMGGKLDIDRAEGIANKEFRLKVDDENSLDMYLASSSANQLTTLYLYFKYWVKEKSNFLIIDEPEENLHPKSQLKLLEILLDFANKNDNRLLLVNHTPLFTEALNNYIMLGTLKKKLEPEEYDNVVRKLKIKDIPINKEDVGIYFFNGNEIREYEVGEYGTTFKDFDREIYKVKNTSEELSSLILEAKTNVSIPT